MTAFAGRAQNPLRNIHAPFRAKMLGKAHETCVEVLKTVFVKS
jgi:hypothetical protein